MAFEDIIQTPQVICRLLQDDGLIPNNPRLPLLVYQRAVQLPAQNPANIIEEIFAVNRWGRSWRNGIYSFHHYHSTAHEVLACYSGSVKVKMGGESGMTLSVQRGDVLIIPAGVGHKNLGSSSDFGVVGAYPPGPTWDMNTGKPGERPQADENIARVPLPPADPIFGCKGPLVEHWLNTE